ncbi:MAG: heme ABC transporter permease [Hyphomicrobiaceae bacterium]
MTSPTLSQRLANPTRFLAIVRWLLPALAVVAALTIAVGLYMAFFVAPVDYQQGQTVRIMFIHVPAAWLAMLGYAMIAISSFGLLVFRHPLADVSAKAAAPIGAAFTALALVTGSLWGKPMWGTYWVWDARLTSVLILFFLYLGLIALRSSLDDETLAGKLTAILAIVGVVILPFIKISVEGLSIPWLGINIPSWNTLHQPSSVLRADGPKIHSSILIPLLVNAVGFSLLFFAMHMKAMKNEILRRRVAALTRAAVERAEREGARIPAGAGAA